MSDIAPKTQVLVNANEQSAASENTLAPDKSSTIAVSDILKDENVRFRLPFGFAKRHSVLVANDQGVLRLVCTDLLSANILLEVRRVLKAPFTFDVKTAQEFEQLLTIAYQRDSSEAQQMMEDIGNEVDLYSLADEMTETEDLLENEDDAPIIKLINAMLSEAIKENASDIHIETFEQALRIT
jgi:general secretion pathway protein E